MNKQIYNQNIKSYLTSGYCSLGMKRELHSLRIIFHEDTEGIEMIMYSFYLGEFNGNTILVFFLGARARCENYAFMLSPNKTGIYLSCLVFVQPALTEKSMQWEQRLSLC